MQYFVKCQKVDHLRIAFVWASKKVLAFIHTAPHGKEMMIDGSGHPFCLGTGVGLLTAGDSVGRNNSWHGSAIVCNS
jgi:hypothetical protein